VLGRVAELENSDTQKLLCHAQTQAHLRELQCAVSARPCVENILDNVCSNCGGGFCIRPVRAKTTGEPATISARIQQVQRSKIGQLI
jgi:hypothetical protein